MQKQTIQIKYENANSLFVSWYVSVGCSRDHVVEEGEVRADVLGGPVGEEGVQQTLVTPVEGAGFLRVRDESL